MANNLASQLLGTDLVGKEGVKFNVAFDTQSTVLLAASVFAAVLLSVILSHFIIKALEK